MSVIFRVYRHRFKTLKSWYYIPLPVIVLVMGACFLCVAKYALIVVSTYCTSHANGQKIMVF